MCGRVTHILTWEQIHDISGSIVPSIPIIIRYNVPPGQDCPILRLDESGNLHGYMLRWGLIPHWAKDIKIGYSLINARAETVESKPSFRAAFKSRRCVVPVSGFYEWQKLADKKTKQPYYFYSPDKAPLLFAGLWETWEHLGDHLESFTIITTTANETMQSIHDRMPVILDPKDLSQWLNPALTVKGIKHFLVPATNEAIVKSKVSTLVNKPSNNLPQCVEPLDENETDIVNSA